MSNVTAFAGFGPLNMLTNVKAKDFKGRMADIEAHTTGKLGELPADGFSAQSMESFDNSACTLYRGQKHPDGSQTLEVGYATSSREWLVQKTTRYTHERYDIKGDDVKVSIRSDMRKGISLLGGWSNTDRKDLKQVCAGGRSVGANLHQAWKFNAKTEAFTDPGFFLSGG